MHKLYIVFIFCFTLIFSSTAVFAKKDKREKWPDPPKVGVELSIEDTVYGVLRNHRNLRGLLENRQVLKHELKRAQAGFGPKVDVEGSIGPSILSDASTRANDLDGTIYTYASLSARLVQPIWDGFATRSRVREAMSTLFSVNHRMFDAATSLSLDAIIAHIDLLRQKRLYQFAQDNINRHKEILRQTQERVSFGADTEADVSQAETRLTRAQSYLAEAKASLSSAESTYFRLTGLRPDKLNEITLPPMVYKTSEKIYEDAKKNNPKLAAYLQDIKAERAKKELAESTFYPTFNIEAGPSVSDRAGNRDRWVRSMDVMLTMRWNVFNSGADVSEINAAYARMRQARQQMYDYNDTLKLDIETTWFAYQSAKDQYQLYSKACELSKVTHKAYLEQFFIGRRSLLDVLDTVSEIYNSSTQAETARSNVLIGAYRLSALTGLLLPSMKINTRPLKAQVPIDRPKANEKFTPGWFK